MVPPLCDGEFHVWFQIPKGSLVCNRLGRGESMREQGITLHTEDQGQLPGDKGFLFTFVSVVETFCAIVKTGQAKWLFCHFHMKSE